MIIIDISGNAYTRTNGNVNDNTESNNKHNDIYNNTIYDSC